MNAKPVLLSIIELGGYPDFRPLYESLGFEVIIERSIRKGLARIKKQRPDVVVAEFIYSPTYGTKISNLDSLFGGLERLQPRPGLIVLIDKQHDHHLDQLAQQHAVDARIHFPVSPPSLKQALTAVCAPGVD